jgi:hypothetical protein
MTNFTYNPLVPNPPNNPSNDVGDMQIDSMSINAIWTIDHYGFNDNNGGIHKQVRMPVLGTLPGAPTSSPSYGALYTKLASSISPGQESDLFYTQDNLGHEYQITRTIGAQFAGFGSVATYTADGGLFPVAPFTAGGGWTFLPGGLILQYGTYSNLPNLIGTSGTIFFPFPFPNSVASITLGPVIPVSASVGIRFSTITTSSFGYFVSQTGGGQISWMAIGN